MEYKLIALWFLLGFLISIRIKAIRTGIITVDDLISSMLFSFFGPLHLVLVIMEFVANRKDVVLWKSKSNKIKELLYKNPPKKLNKPMMLEDDDE